MTKLRKLNAIGAKIIDDDIIGMINLEVIKISDKITNLNHMTRLRELTISRSCEITNDGIMNLTNLEKISIDSSIHITTLNHMSKLKELKIIETDSLTDKGILNLTNLEKMDIHRNHAITNINHMKKLKELTVNSSRGLTDKGIDKLTNLEKIDLYDVQIKNINTDNLTKLTIGSRMILRFNSNK